MDAIWNTTSTEEDDLYKILRSHEFSTTDQINTEYKILAREHHPDKNPNDPQAAEKFNKIQRARDVLVNEETRADYDKWRRSGLTISYETWLATHGAAHVSLHWALKKSQPALEDCSTSQTFSYLTQSDYMPGFSKTEPSFYEEFGWQRDNSNNILTKFRNYQI